MAWALQPARPKDAPWKHPITGEEAACDLEGVGYAAEWRDDPVAAGHLLAGPDPPDLVVLRDWSRDGDGVE